MEHVLKGGFTDGLLSCPLCGGRAQAVRIEGDDFIMRCSRCFAATKRARQSIADAARDWQSGDIDKEPYLITQDVPIDEYLAEGVRDILFGEYSNIEDFPETKDGFLCSEAVIVTEKRKLIIELINGVLSYDEISGCAFKRSLAEEGKIRFLSCSWKNDSLISLAFSCDEKRIVIRADEDEDCLAVQEK